MHELPPRPGSNKKIGKETLRALKVSLEQEKSPSQENSTHSKTKNPPKEIPRRNPSSWAKKLAKRIEKRPPPEIRLPEEDK